MNIEIQSPAHLESAGTLSSDQKELLERAKYQLTTVLSFFPRVDAKASVLFGLNVGMLALLANNAPSFKLMDWYMALALLPVLLIAASLLYLYMQAFPSLSGGAQSLIYFREIANRTEVLFLQEFMNRKSDLYIQDVLGQVWRNSEILKKKYNNLKMAFAFTAIAVIPWALSLAMLVANNPQSNNLLSK